MREPPRRTSFPIWKIVIAIILAVAIINAILAAGGHSYLGADAVAAKSAHARGSGSDARVRQTFSWSLPPYRRDDVLAWIHRLSGGVVRG
jgi:hypothetical protein